MKFKHEDGGKSEPNKKVKFTLLGRLAFLELLVEESWNLALAQEIVQNFAGK
jgi:hypothetical protein